MRELGFSEIKLQRMMVRPQESIRGNENIATPRTAAMLMARIYISVRSRCRVRLCEDLRSLLAIPKAAR